MQSPVWMLSGIIAWFGIVPSIAGAIVCLLHLDRSRWVALLAGGFGFQVFASIYQRVAPLLIGQSLSPSSTSFGMVFVIGSTLALVAHAAIVCGIAGLLHEARPKQTKPAPLVGQ